MAKYYIFRTDYGDDETHRWLMDELYSNGTLRQGWGVRELQLKEVNGSTVDIEVWKNRYKAVWDDTEDAILRRYTILSRMLDINEGDLIVIPKTAIDEFTICEASGSYSYDFNGKTKGGNFRHIIPVRNPKPYNYSSSREAKIISSKFKAYQSAVNNVWLPGLIDTIIDLYKKEPSRKRESIVDIVKQLEENALIPIKANLLEIDPNSFEDIIEICLKSRGYGIIGRHRYDGKGADVDIIASYSLPYFSDILETAPVLLIQIKKKIGTDLNDIEGVNQLIKSGKEYENALKILMTTTDKISPEAKELADTHGINIIYNLDVIKFILKTHLKDEVNQYSIQT